MLEEADEQNLEGQENEAEEIDVVDLMEPGDVLPMDELTESDSNPMPPLIDIDEDEVVQPVNHGNLPLPQPEPAVQNGQMDENMTSDDEEIQEEDLLGYVGTPPNQVQDHNEDVQELQNVQNLVPDNLDGTV